MLEYGGFYIELTRKFNETEWYRFLILIGALINGIFFFFMYTIEELKAHPMRIISTILACDTSGLFLIYMSLHTCDFSLHKIFAATYYFDSRCESELNALLVLSEMNAVLAVFYFMATIGLQFCICVDLILSLKRPFAQKETRMNYYFLFSFGLATFNAICAGMFMSRKLGQWLFVIV